mgnify:FL=1
MPYPSGKKTYYYLGIVLILTITFHYLGFLKPVEKILRSITIPPISKVYGFSVGLNDNYRFFKNKKEFFKAYRESAKENERLKEAEAKYKLLLQENEELKKQLNYQKKIKNLGVVAEVIGKEILSTDQNIIINHGTKDKIKIGYPVIAGEGILVGKIVKVEENISIVKLINDNQSRIGATILNRDHSVGVVEGGYGISLRMTFIPRDEIVVVGDQIITSGLEANIPRGLLIGSGAVVEN